MLSARSVASTFCNWVNIPSWVEPDLVGNFQTKISSKPEPLQSIYKKLIPALEFYKTENDYLYRNVSALTYILCFNILHTDSTFISQFEKKAEELAETDSVLDKACDMVGRMHEISKFFKGNVNTCIEDFQNVVAPDLMQTNEEIKRFTDYGAINDLQSQTDKFIDHVYSTAISARDMALTLGASLYTCIQTNTTECEAKLGYLSQELENAFT